MHASNRHIPLSRRLRPVVQAGGLLLSLLALRWSLDAPQQDSSLLALSILAALPWSLLLTVLDLSAGFGDRAAWIITAGIALNILMVWTIAGWLWDLFPHDTPFTGRTRSRSHPKDLHV